MDFKSIIERLQKSGALEKGPLAGFSGMYPSQRWAQVDKKLAEAHMAVYSSYGIGYYNLHLGINRRPLGTTIQHMTYLVEVDDGEKSGVQEYLGQPIGYYIDLVEVFLMTLLHRKESSAAWYKMDDLYLLEDRPEAVRSAAVRTYENYSTEDFIRLLKRMSSRKDFFDTEKFLSLFLNYMYSTDKMIMFDNCLDIYMDYWKLESLYPKEAPLEKVKAFQAATRTSESQEI